jgi:hypothetical protein
MPDGSHPPILAGISSRSDRKPPVALRRKLLSGLVFAAGLIVCALIALVSVAVALLATVLNGVRALRSP